ncbi:glycosyltransferase [Granulicella cerasi]|uniref:Glycosyltransferase n=1 Tax=Granulicella cerasi TaxID=741063 RepID=A0ABW1Z634_9BACT|nr:glycosyltransferase [Granulicella cerasi]
MIWWLLFSAIGLISGFVLMTRAPAIDNKPTHEPGEVHRPLSIIIPARNEERNIAKLLASIGCSPALEVIVVNDSSQDATAEVARSLGARVIRPTALPDGFTGKAWACTEGARVASHELLLFLDADTQFDGGGLHALSHMAGLSDMQNSALSVFPFTATERSYEELSLFFNLLMAFGTGGFGSFRESHLFGQSLLISRENYWKVGGHASVGRHVLENLHLASKLREAGVTPVCRVGRGTLRMRMFPDGFRQLVSSWTKAFANGAQVTDRKVLLVSIVWLSALSSAALIPFFAHGAFFSCSLALYVLASIEVFFFARQIGSFRLYSCVLYPVPLVFFFGIFARSAYRRAMNRPSEWKGRAV